MRRESVLIFAWLFVLQFYGLATAQFVPNVPIETRSLGEIYANAQREQCDLRVVGGGDGKALSSCAS